MNAASAPAVLIPGKASRTEAASTSWAGPSSVSAEEIDAYAPVQAANAKRFANPDAVGDPRRGALGRAERGPVVPSSAP